MRRILRALGALILWPCLLSGAQAAVITFDDMIDGTPVRDYYAGAGVGFDLATAITAGLSLNEIDFPPHSGNTVAYDNTGPVGILFTAPVSSAFAFFTYATRLQLTAYDASGSLLQSIFSGYANNTVSDGAIGSVSNEQLGFSFSTPLISRIVVAGDLSGSSFVFDDLTFRGAPSNEVPEPFTIALVALSLCCGLRTRGRGRAPTAAVGAARLPRRTPMLAVVASFALLALPGAATAQKAQTEREFRRPPPAPSAARVARDQATALAAATAVQLTGIDVSPNVIPNGIASRVMVKVDVQGTNILPGGVLVQAVDDQGRVVRALGSLNDSGVAPDEGVNDGRYTGAFMLTEPVERDIRLVVSVAVRGSPLRTRSEPFEVAVRSDAGVATPDGRLWGNNSGSGGIALWFGGDIPSSVTTFRLQRAVAGTTDWTTVRDIDAATEPRLPISDFIDGRTASYSYRLQYLNASGGLVDELGVLTLPRSLEPPDAPNATGGNKRSDAALPGVYAINPIVNTTFISDAVMEDPTSMTAQQILDLFNERGSFLRKPKLTDAYNDVDGVDFFPASLIKQLAGTYRINPQVILVTMQKESGLVLATTQPPQPTDGFMGAKGCTKTLRAQLTCAVSKLREFLDTIDTNGQTIGGWAPGVQNFTCAGVAPTCAIEKLPVTPANRATAALWQYTPVIGARWGGTPDYAGNSIFPGMWYHPTWTTTLFRNLTNVIRWKACTTCPQAPAVFPSNPTDRGSLILMGSNDVALPETGLQPRSRHGLSGRLPANSSYKVKASCSLNTWDSYNALNPNVDGTGYWDAFVISLSSVPYWQQSLTDPVSAPYSFGGNNFLDGLPSSKSEVVTRNIPASSLGQPYFNVILDTATLPQADTNYPSWGKCQVKEVVPTDTLPSLGIIRMPD